VDVT
jgi:hypothetical protein